MWGGTAGRARALLGLGGAVGSLEDLSSRHTWGETGTKHRMEAAYVPEAVRQSSTGSWPSEGVVGKGVIAARRIRGGRKTAEAGGLGQLEARC